MYPTKSNMNKRNSLTRKNVSMGLKFSNTSVSSARARVQQRPPESVTNGTSATPTQQPVKRRKHFNASTELPHIVSLMAMSLCRRITNLAFIHRRLLVYLGLVFIGGLLNDFASFLLRALFISLSSNHFLNQFVVKLAWAWNLAILVPLICITSNTVRKLDGVVFAEMEQSLEDYYEKRSQRQSSISTSAPPAKIIVSLQSLSVGFQSQMVDEYQTRIVEDDRKAQGGGRLSRLVRSLMVPDLVRVAICTGIYLASMAAFQAIRQMTGRQISSNVDLMTTTTASASPTLTGGIDLSGHIFILVFSNLMIIEECTVMTGWESLGDRLYSLSSEYMNLEITNIQQELNAAASGTNPTEQPLPAIYSQSNRILYLCWNRYRSRNGTIRILFLLVALLSLIYDFMILQTAFFYHSLMEKLVALFWAYGAWYLAYRIMFPMLGIPVRQVIPWI